MNNSCVCNLCFKNAKSIGMIVDGYWLVYYKKKYHVVTNPGHITDILFTFPEKPYPDYFMGMSDKKINILCDENPGEKIFNKWMRSLDKLNEIKLAPEDGYRLIKTCVESKKYNPEKHGFNFMAWMMHRCGLLVEKYEINVRR